MPSPRVLILFILSALLCGLPASPLRADEPAQAESRIAVPSPAWIPGAAIYEVSLRSMSSDSRFFTFEERMMKLKGWGADAVCFEPVFAISEDRTPGQLNDVRAVRDFGALSYEFGTRDAFKSLMGQAEFTGIKVLLTWVADTTSLDHAWVKNKPEWYVKDASGSVAVLRENPELALLDLSNTALQDEIIKLMKSWVTEYGVHGFKVQVSVPQDAVRFAFWARARKELAASKKDLAWIYSEPSPDAHASAFDVTPSVQSHEFLKKLISGEERPDRLEAFIKEEENSFPAGSARARFLETLHSERARTVFGPAQRAAAVFNATIPGVAWVIAGEEAGEMKVLPLKAKSPIDWNNSDRDLTKFYKSLLRLRRDHPAMARGQVFQLKATRETTGEATGVMAGSRVLAYARTYRDDAVLVVINFSDREWRGTLEVPEIFKSDKGAIRLEPALTDAKFSGNTLTLPPWGSQVFTAK